MKYDDDRKIYRNKLALESNLRMFKGIGTAGINSSLELSINYTMSQTLFMIIIYKFHKHLWKIL